MLAEVFLININYNKMNNLKNDKVFIDFKKSQLSDLFNEFIQDNFVSAYSGIF